MRLVVDNEICDDYAIGVRDGLIAALTAMKSCTDDQYINVGSVRREINTAIEEIKQYEIQNVKGCE